MPAYCSVPLTYAKLMPNVCNVHQPMDKISRTSAYVGAIRYGVSTPLEEEDCTICVAKTKTLTSCAFTAQLICVFVFAHADCWFSYGGSNTVLFCIFREIMEAHLSILGLVPFSVHVLAGTAALLKRNIGETRVSL